MLRGVNCRHIAVMVRARGQVKVPPQHEEKTNETRKIANRHIMRSINNQMVHINVPNTLNILERVNDPTFRGNRDLLSGDLSRMCLDMLERSMSEVSPSQLSKLITNCASLGIFDKKIVRMCTDRLRALTANNTSMSEDLMKCCLTLWSACLWNGLNTHRIVEIMLSGVMNSLLENPPDDWLILSRLSWCIQNDSLTRFDPSLKSRISLSITEKVAPLTIVELCAMLRNDSPEFTIIKKCIYERLIAAVEVEPEQLLGSRNTDVPCRLLEAWAEMRLSPPSLELLKKIVNRCTRPGGASVDRILHCLSVLNYPELDNTLDQNRLKAFLFALPEWKPSLNQVATLCAAFPVLGLMDMESNSFLSGHLNRVLGDSTSKLSASDSEASWQIGFWYSHLQRSASETTLAALNDIFRPLMVKIASNMWDKQGLFVRKEDSKSLHPTERAVRTIVHESLSSLGITALKNIHIVNTPFVMPLYLQDRNMGIVFVREGDQVLSDGRFIGTVGAMKNVIGSHGSQIRIFDVADYDRAFNELSSEDFMEKLLRDIQ